MPAGFPKGRAPRQQRLGVALSTHWRLDGRLRLASPLGRHDGAAPDPGPNSTAAGPGVSNTWHTGAPTFRPTAAPLPPIGSGVVVDDWESVFEARLAALPEEEEKYGSMVT